MAIWSPVWTFDKDGPTAGHWAGWVDAVDPDTGAWKGHLKSNDPIVSGMTPTPAALYLGDQTIILRKMGPPCLTGLNCTMSNNGLRSKELPSCCRVAALSAPTRPA